MQQALNFIQFSVNVVSITIDCAIKYVLQLIFLAANSFSATCVYYIIDKTTHTHL